jgi:hypothetical protein
MSSDLNLPYYREINFADTAFQIIRKNGGGIVINAESYGTYMNPDGTLDPSTAISCGVDSGGDGIFTWSEGAGGSGIRAQGDFGVSGFGGTAGIWGQNRSNRGYGVIGYDLYGGIAVCGTSASGLAGLFNGPVQVTKSLAIDQNNTNSGYFNNSIDTGNGLFFGPHSGEGIASTRIGTTNLHGLDFYTDFESRLSIDHDGNVNVPGDIILTNSDCAEDFDIHQDHNVDPGTVMVLNEEGLLEPSQQPYDKKVAGVISGAGKYKPGIILGKQQSDNKRKPISLVGKVYCKVDAKSSAIQIGDLLTTSSTAGHAMKAEDPYKAFGAVIGKAMGHIKQEKGMIPVLVALQ